MRLRRHGLSSCLGLAAIGLLRTRRQRCVLRACFAAAGSHACTACTAWQRAGAAGLEKALPARPAPTPCSRPHAAPQLRGAPLVAILRLLAARHAR